MCLLSHVQAFLSPCSEQVCPWLQVAEVRSATKREDFSDMVAERAATQKRKLQQKAQADGKKQKTGKEFKF